MALQEGNFLGGDGNFLSGEGNFIISDTPEPTPTIANAIQKQTVGPLRSIREVPKNIKKTWRQ